MDKGVVYYFGRVPFRVVALDQFYERSQSGPDTCLYMIVHVYTHVLEKKVALWQDKLLKGDELH